MKCNKCGTNIKKEDLFCPDCGSKIKTKVVAKEKTVSKNKLMSIFIISAIVVVIVLAMSLLFLKAGIVCETPYIQVGKECCIDTDSNSICDKDKTQTKTEDNLALEKNTPLYEGGSIGLVTTFKTHTNKKEEQINLKPDEKYPLILTIENKGESTAKNIIIKVKGISQEHFKRVDRKSVV